MFRTFLHAAAALLFLSTTAAEASWCHINFRATDGTDIAMDYRLEEGFSRFNGRIYYLANTWIHLSNATLAGDEHVQVVLMSANRHSGYTYSKFDLSAHWYDDRGRFSAASDSPIVASSQYDNQNVIEFAVVVDGTWLKDPINGSSNFRLDPALYPNSCPNPT